MRMQMPSYIRMVSRVLLLALSLVVLVSGPAAAQVTLFQPPDTAVDLSRYRNMEMCRAAVERVAKWVHNEEYFVTGVWRDTIPTEPKLFQVGGPPLPVEARESAKECLQSAAIPYSVDPGDPWDHSFFVALVYDAGFKERAIDLIKERMATFNLASDSAVVAAIDTISGYMGKLNPPPWELIQIIEEEYVPRIMDVRYRIDALFELAALYVHVDSAKSYEYAARMLQVVQSLDEQEYEKLRRESKYKGLFRSEQNEIADRLLAFFLEATGDEPALDSLRSSTDAYVRHKKELWGLVNREPAEAYPVPIGERAPEIEADFWLGCDSPCGPRPTPGRVSLVIPYSFYTAPAEVCRDADCLRWMATLRRLEKRFPELETTIVDRTRGAYAYMRQTPEKEAELTRQWLDQRGIRAALAMAETQHWYLPEPDGRRINQLTANEKNYSFGGRWNRITEPDSDVWALLFDREGRLVEITEMRAKNEIHLTRLIEVLLEREKPRS